MAVDQTTLDEIWAIHLPYELDMMEHTLSLLTLGVCKEGILANALIESFCIHCRALIEFLQGQGGSDPYWFVQDTFKKPDFADVAAEIRKLHTQIAHLTGERTDDPKKKLDDAARVTLFNKILSEFETFAMHLKPQYAKTWKAHEI